MSNEVGIGAITGGIQLGTSGGLLGAGLVAAELVSGPVGWGILAGSAVLGGITGGFGDSKARKSKKYAKKAAAIQMQRESNAAEATMLQYIREGRITRAYSASSADTLGISSSSLSTSSLSSVGSQTGYNLQYLANDRRLYILYSVYMSKARKAAQAYQTTLSLQGAASSLATSIGSFAMSNPEKTASIFNAGGGNGTTEWLGIQSGTGNRVNDAAFGVAGTYA